MSEWKIQQGRVSLLPSVAGMGKLPSPLKLFTAIWDREPENFQNPAHINPLSPAIANGDIGEMVGGITVHPLRIDITLSALAPTQLATSPILIGDVARYWENMRLLAARVADLDIPLTIGRVASFTQVTDIEADRASANKIISRVLPAPFTGALTDERDFTLQLNKPAKSQSVDGIEMNYLTRWSVDVIQLLTLNIATQVEQGNNASPSAMHSVASFTAANISFDFNNAQVERALTDQEQSLLLTETVAKAEGNFREIVKSGGADA